jgi:hypothetical protein
MPRIEITFEDIQRGLPPKCIYCGELTEDQRAFLLEETGPKRWISLPHCEIHLFMQHIVYGLYPIGILLLIAIAVFLNSIDIDAISETAIVAMFWFLSSGFLRSCWFPRAIGDGRVQLRNVHRQFCTSLFEQRAERTDGSDQDND